MYNGQSKKLTTGLLKMLVFTYDDYCSSWFWHLFLRQALLCLQGPQDCALPGMHLMRSTPVKAMSMNNMTVSWLWTMSIDYVILRLSCGLQIQRACRRPPSSRCPGASRRHPSPCCTWYGGAARSRWQMSRHGRGVRCGPSPHAPGWRSGACNKRKCKDCFGWRAWPWI